MKIGKMIIQKPKESIILVYGFQWEEISQKM